MELVRYLTGVIALFTTCAKTGRWQNEDFLRDCIHLANAFGVADNGQLGLTHFQWDRTGWRMRTEMDYLINKMDRARI